MDIKLKKYLYMVLLMRDYVNNEYKYLPITCNLYEGDNIYIGKISLLKIGNIIPVRKVVNGSWIHNIENIPTRGAIFVRNSKISAFLIYLGRKYVTVKLPSGEIRLLYNNVFCIFGELNANSISVKKGKAGINRLFGKRSKVRGVAMNACDHPHGGGEGKNSIGRSSIYSFWGCVSKGVLTRRSKKYSRKLILNRK